MSNNNSDRYNNPPHDPMMEWRNRMKLRGTNSFLDRGDRISVESIGRADVHWEADFVSYGIGPGRYREIWIKWDRRPGVIQEYDRYSPLKLRKVYKRSNGRTFERTSWRDEWVCTDNEYTLRGIDRVDYSAFFE